TAHRPAMRQWHRNNTIPLISNTTMRVLLTGASGFLGANLLRQIPFYRPEWDLHSTLFSIVPSDNMPNTHHLDVRDPNSVARLMDKVQPQLILHTAALIEPNQPEAMYETN